MVTPLNVPTLPFLQASVKAGDAHRKTIEVGEIQRRVVERPETRSTGCINEQYRTSTGHWFCRQGSGDRRR